MLKSGWHLLPNPDRTETFLLRPSRKYTPDALMTPNRLLIKSVPGKGRGVFAASSYAAGELIEECPIIVLDREEVAHAEKTILDHYYYDWKMESEGSCAVVLGFGMLYNHSNHPNARYSRQLDALTITYHALREIRPGEEITVNYRGAKGGDDPLWFEPVE